MHVTSPAGRTFTVSRRWLPWRRRVPGPEGGDGDYFDFDIGDDPLSLLIGLLALIVLLPFLLMLLLGLLEILLLVALFPVVLAARSLLGVPWVLEVRTGNNRFGGEVVHSEKVRGWRNSSARISELADTYAAG